MPIKKYIIYPFLAFAVFVFLQALPFKLHLIASYETTYIFSTVGEWFRTVGLGFIATPFTNYGSIVVGLTELTASILMLIPVTRWMGSLLGLGVITGALFFHLCTPLGTHIVINASGATDGGALFHMAIGTWISCVVVFILSKKPKFYL